MNIIKVIAVLGLFALTYFLGDTFFYRNSLMYENGRHFNEATLTVYNEQAITVYFLRFIAAFFDDSLCWIHTHEEKLVHDIKV